MTMASSGEVAVVVRLTNPNDLGYLLRSIELAHDIVTDQPWNDDAKEIAELLELACQGLTLHAAKRNEQT
jgi:hypothetical protein